MHGRAFLEGDGRREGHGDLIETTTIAVRVLENQLYRSFVQNTYTEISTHSIPNGIELTFENVLNFHLVLSRLLRIC